MPKFSLKSKQILATCHPDLRKVCNELIKYIDFSVICGYRRKEDQDKAYAEGKSRLQWPKSAHNGVPSEAVDIIPYPVDWENIGRFQQLRGAFKVVAKQLFEAGEIESEFKWGGDFVKFKDYPHYEIIRKEK